MPSEVTVKVLLNQTNRFMQYRAVDQLYQAAEFVDTLPTGGVDNLLVNIWHQLNVDYPTTDWAQRYRENRNRSLSVGDVVVIGETAHAVDMIGWSVVPLSQDQVHHDLDVLQSMAWSESDDDFLQRLTSGLQ
jgi:hypothetical protein